MAEHAETQAQRRVKYGLNVLVAALVAVALVGFLNVITVRKFVRWDLTAEGRYSLSPQTKKVLANLAKPVRIVSLLNPADEHLERARDLVQEYGKKSDKVTVEIINPTTELSRRDAFYEELQKRYADQLKPLRDAVTKARAALTKFKAEAPALTEPVKALKANAAIEGNLKQAVDFAEGFLASFTDDKQFQSRTERIDQPLEGSLPDYAGAQRRLQTELEQLDDICTQLAKVFKGSGDKPGLPNDLKELLLKAADQFSKTEQAMLAPDLAALRDAKPVEAYDELIQKVRRNVIVILGDKQERTLGVQDLFRAPDAMNSGDNAQPEVLFQGEERMTGALVSLNQAHDPMVVLVTTGADDPLGQNTQFGYHYVAERLRNARFDVQTWNPRPQQRNQFQPPQGPAPPPEPVAGQKCVWVYLASVTPAMPDPMSKMYEGQVVSHLRERMALGDGVMIILSPELTPFGMSTEGNPYAELVKEFGITPQLDRVIVREIVTPERKKLGIPQFEIARWPEDADITKVMQGMPGISYEASPLVLGDTSKDKDLKLYKLGTLSAPRMWAATDYAHEGRNPENIKYNESTKADEYTFAAAAQKGKQRLVVMTDRFFASNALAAMSAQVIPIGQVIIYPGNTELFINSIYWLEGMDEMIAASARTQDIRRVSDLSPTGADVLEYTLLAGLPLATIAAGVGVWFVRRKD
jgi:ABC-type uncharacterized transport system